MSTIYTTSGDDLTSIANAIRTKGGTSASLSYPTDFITAINNISGGDSNPVAEPKDVNFIDYDGTVRYSYTTAEFIVLTELPANPTHPGLTAQGWNWTLTAAKTNVMNYGGPLTIGQLYTTSDGKTRVYVQLDDGCTSPYLGVAPNGTVVVDWGDGSATTSLTGTSLSVTQWTPMHTYPSAGGYVITLTVSSGSASILGTTNANGGCPLLRGITSNSNTKSQYAYRNSIIKIEMGDNMRIGQAGFEYCQSLQTISMSSTSLPAYANYAFFYCYALKALVVPSESTTLGTYFCDHCYSLRFVSLPSNITTINRNAFYYCTSLKFLKIPEGVTAITTYTFAYVNGLGSITIPASVTSVAAYGLGYMYGLDHIKFRGTTPPTFAAATVWTSLPTTCKIYVPAGYLSTYTSAANYPSSSTYTYVEY